MGNKQIYLSSPWSIIESDYLNLPLSTDFINSKVFVNPSISNLTDKIIILTKYIKLSNITSLLNRVITRIRRADEDYEYIPYNTKVKIKFEKCSNLILTDSLLDDLEQVGLTTENFLLGINSHQGGSLTGVGYVLSRASI